MRRFLLVPTLAALSLVWLVSNASAQEVKKSRGSVTAMAADSITVKVGTTDMKFGVDDKTSVVATGGSTKTRAANAAGRPGPRMSELLKTGDAVEVSYHDMGGGNLHATAIRKVSTPGSGGVPPNRATGTVASVSASSLTLNGSAGGGGTFTQSYAIDEKTKVVGKGAGTAAAKAGGKISATELIGSGDHVTVSFSGNPGSLHADNITVTMKAAKK